MINISGKYKNNKVDAEIDDYGDLSSFETKGDKWEARIEKTRTRKEIERDLYAVTGIQQLGTTYPNPYSREELIKLEFTNNTIFQSKLVSVIVTVMAMIIDTICYFLLIEENAGLKSTYWFDYLPAIGAAIAIDFIPIFIAQNIHRLNVDRKKVIKAFNILSILLIFIFIAVMLAYRILNIYNDNENIKKTIWAIFMFLIPIATTTSCFIVSYISYNPIKKEYQTLKTQELFIQENINEIEAMLKEAESYQNYKENLITQDNSLYNSAYELIDTIGQYYRSYIRTEIIPLLNSPADTTDLSADREIKPVGKINIPMYYPNENTENDDKGEI